MGDNGGMDAEEDDGMAVEGDDGMEANRMAVDGPGVLGVRCASTRWEGTIYALPLNRVGGCSFSFASWAATRQHRRSRGRSTLIVDVVW